MNGFGPWRWYCGEQACASFFVVAGWPEPEGGYSNQFGSGCVVPNEIGGRKNRSALRPAVTTAVLVFAYLAGQYLGGRTHLRQFLLGDGDEMNQIVG